MKIKRAANLIILVFFTINTYSQDNSAFKIDVGGKSILIPPPLNGFVEAGDTKRIVAENQVPKQNKLVAYYLSEDIAKKVDVLPIQKMLIEIDKSKEFFDCSANDFKDVKESLKYTFSSNGLLEIIKDANTEFKRTEDIVGKAEIGEMKPIGSVFDTSDAIAFLVVTKYNFEQGVAKVIGGVSCIRVKNRLLLIYVFNSLENEESINWVSRVAQNWSISILNANLEIEKGAPKVNSSNALMNLFNSIIGLFRELITKTPLTFICLILFMVIYYIFSRKLLSGYLKSTKNQTLIFLYFKTIIINESKKHNVEHIFLKTVEFLIIIFSFLALLNAFGLPIPNGVV